MTQIPRREYALGDFLFTGASRRYGIYSFPAPHFPSLLKQYLMLPSESAEPQPLRPILMPPVTLCDALESVERVWGASDAVAVSKVERNSPDEPVTRERKESYHDEMESVEVRLGRLGRVVALVLVLAVVSVRLERACETKW